MNCCFSINCFLISSLAFTILLCPGLLIGFAWRGGVFPRLRLPSLFYRLLGCPSLSFADGRDHDFLTASANALRLGLTAIYPEVSEIEKNSKLVDLPF